MLVRPPPNGSISSSKAAAEAPVDTNAGAKVQRGVDVGLAPVKGTAHAQDGMDAAATAATATAGGSTASLRRTSGAGLTAKLVDPKRATETEQTLGAMLSFTPEELAYARSHPVVLSADHNGAALAGQLAAFLQKQGIPVTELSAPMAAAAKGEKFPYAEAALPALVALTNGSAARVVLICGNGIGMRDVAREWPGARVSYGEIQHEVRSSRKAEDANVLALGARLFGEDADLAKLFLKTFVATPYQGMPERYAAQTGKIQAWARLAQEKGAGLSLDDFAALGGTPPTEGALTLTELRLRGKKD